MEVRIIQTNRRMDIEDVKEAMFVLNEGLSLGVGASGMSLMITPKDGLPQLTCSFTWTEFLQRLLAEPKK